MHGTTRRTLGFLAVAFALLAPAGLAGQHFPPDEDVQVMLDYLVEDGAAPGIVLALVEADGSVRILTAGSGGPETRPLGPRSVFEIGSINKTFTGALLADMVARGEVALDDHVAEYLPDHVQMPSWDGREITLLDLATHRSGLTSLPYNLNPQDPADPYAAYTVELLYEFLSDHELRREPGAEAEYSNLGFGLLGHALARAAGQSYRDLLRDRILDPVGMDMTGYALDGEVAEWMVKGYGEAGGDVVAYWFTTEAMQGAGGLRSNMEDMVAYLNASLGAADSDVQRALRDAREVRRPMGEDVGIGLGWQVRSLQGRSIVSHSGVTGGFRSSIGFAPDPGVGFVLLTNARDIGDDIGLDLLAFGPPLDLPETTVAAETLAEYGGEYQVRGAGRVVVRLEDEGWLTLRTPGNVRFRMYAESDTSFFLKRVPWRFTFTRGEGGAVAGVVADIGGRELRGRKVSDDAPTPAEEPEVLDLPVSAEDIARYEGTYHLGVGERTLELRIFGRNGRLVSQAAGQDVAALRFQGDHVFVPDFDDAVRLVFTVEDGRATAVTLHQGSAEITGEREVP